MYVPVNQTDDPNPQRAAVCCDALAAKQIDVSSSVVMNASQKTRSMSPSEVPSA